MKLEDKGVLVTGGASGLGAACVRLLSQAGAKVVIADLNSDAGIALATEHSHTGESTLFVKTNVTEEESTRAAVRTAVESFGGLHILINCAGIGIAERVLGKSGPASLESFTRVIQVNLIGTFNAIRLAVAEMAENAPNEEGERGVIINTASVAAFLALFVVRACWLSTSSLARTLDFINDFWTVKLAVEIGIQVVSLVSHQGAEWPIGRRDTAIA